MVGIPTAVTPTPTSPTSIDLTWAAAAGAATYDVEENGVVVVTGHGSTSLTRTGLMPSTSYVHRVRGRGTPGDGFILGATEPAAGNVGVGVLRAAPTITLTGDQTVADYGTLADRIIDGRVFLGAGSTLENCLVRGPLVKSTTSGPLVRGPLTGTVRANVLFCTVKPQTASSYIDGIGYKNVYAYRTEITETTDGMGLFSLTVDGLVNVLAEGVWIHHLAQHAPDIAASRTETHNDCVQMQGNLGGATDTVFDGCSFDGRHSLTAGDVPPYRTQLSALMINTNTQTECSFTFKRGWLKGGIYCVNGAGDNAAGSSVVIEDTRMERPGTDVNAPAASIAMSATQNLTKTNVTYIDNGLAVPTYAV